MDKMTDEELRAFRDQKIIELRAHRRRFHPEQAAEGTLYPASFSVRFTTLPRNRASRPSAGLMPHPVAGLHRRKYARDFLLAVMKEGFGRINHAVDGRNYIQWTGDSRYAFADAPVGRRGEMLIPRHSCAISSHNKFCISTLGFGSSPKPSMTKRGVMNGSFLISVLAFIRCKSICTG